MGRTGQISNLEWQQAGKTIGNPIIPQKFNAHIKNPDRGFVSSANQRPV